MLTPESLPLTSSRHLYGLDNSHLVPFGKYLLEQQTLSAFLPMQSAARLAGFELSICSAFRDFERQVAIWNAKALGQRPVLDSQSCPVDISQLTPNQIMDAILLWSALPGTSRHHWGTDIDVFDANTIEQSALNLVTAEYQSAGPCHGLYIWLSQHAWRYGFYFPYQAGKSGVSPEPWHLSYAPVASGYLNDFNIQDLHQLISNSDISLKNDILARLDELVGHYVHFVAPAPANN